MKPRIEAGDGIELRVLRLRDADCVYAAIDANRSYLAEWLPWVNGTESVRDTLTFISSQLEKFALRQGVTYGIWADGTYAGNVSLHAIDSIHRHAEIGYWLAAAFAGRGVMTRACGALAKHAFEELRLHRLEIRAAVGNVKSRAVAERLGFVPVGVVRGAERVGDRDLDHVVYGLSANEWNMRSART